MMLADATDTYLWVIRHPEFSTICSTQNGQNGGGEPTPEGLAEFMRHASPLVQKDTAVIAGDAPRHLIPARKLCEEHKLDDPRVFPEFSPLTTINFPPLLGGRLYDRLHRSQVFNRFCLIEWGNGAPFFKKSPREVRRLVDCGVERLVREVKANRIILVSSQEILMFLEHRLNDLPLGMALRLEVPHSAIRTFVLNRKR